VWIALSLVFLALACLLLWRALRPPPEATLLGVAYALSCAPLLDNFRQGQVYTLLLMLLALTLWGYRRRSGWLTGVPLALMFLFKSASVVLWLFLLVRRRWSALAWAAATVLAGIVLTLPWFGLDMWIEYVSLVPEIARQPYQGIIALQTLPSFIHHLLRYDAQWNPYPLVDMPGLAYALATVVPLVILLVSGWLARARDGQPDERGDLLAFAAGTALAVPLAPWAQEYHYVLLLPALALVGLDLLRRETPLWTWGLFIFSAFLLWTPLPFSLNAKAKGLKGFFGFPRVYGALAVAGLALYLRHRTVEGLAPVGATHASPLQTPTRG
jgi:hypothetical protein